MLPILSSRQRQQSGNIKWDQGSCKVRTTHNSGSFQSGPVLHQDNRSLNSKKLCWFWVCPQPSTQFFSTHSTIVSWLRCCVPPGQKPLVPKSWSAPITPNSFFLLRYVVHTCGLLISCLQIVTHRTARYYRECYQRNLLFQWPTWQPQVKHHFLSLPHRNPVNCIYSQNHPLSQPASPVLGDIICAAGASSVQKATITQSGRWIPSTSHCRGVSLQVSPLSLLSYFKSKPGLLVLRAPWTTHVNTLKTCSIM